MPRFLLLDGKTVLFEKDSYGYNTYDSSAAVKVNIPENVTGVVLNRYNPVTNLIKIRLSSVLEYKIGRKKEVYTTDVLFIPVDFVIPKFEG